MKKLTFIISYSINNGQKESSFTCLDAENKIWNYKSKFQFSNKLSNSYQGYFKKYFFRSSYKVLDLIFILLKSLKQGKQPAIAYNEPITDPFMVVYLLPRDSQKPVRIGLKIKCLF